MFDAALRGHALWATLLRFALVGGASTCLYGLFTWLLVAVAAQPPLLATTFGYLLVIPANFVLQKCFTFRSGDSPRREAPRFLLVHGVNLAASIAGMHVVTGVLHADYRLGIVLTMVMVPVATFIAMHLWVFPGERPAKRGDT